MFHLSHRVHRGSTSFVWTNIHRLEGPHAIARLCLMRCTVSRHSQEGKGDFLSAKLSSRCQSKKLAHGAPLRHPVLAWLSGSKVEEGGGRVRPLTTQPRAHAWPFPAQRGSGPHMSDIKVNMALKGLKGEGEGDVRRALVQTGPFLTGAVSHPQPLPSPRTFQPLPEPSVLGKQSYSAGPMGQRRLERLTTLSPQRGRGDKSPAPQPARKSSYFRSISSPFTEDVCCYTLINRADALFRRGQHAAALSPKERLARRTGELERPVVPGLEALERHQEKPRDKYTTAWSSSGCRGLPRDVLRLPQQLGGSLLCSLRPGASGGDKRGPAQGLTPHPTR